MTSPHSGDWLLALPISACGLRLDDEAVRIATGLRLGVDLCAQHECPCGALVTADGSHGLSCRLGHGRTARHALINDITWRGLIKAGFPATKKPVGLVRSDGKRPDGITLIAWGGGAGNVSPGTLLSLTPWQSHIVSDRPKLRVLLLLK